MKNLLILVLLITANICKSQSFEYYDSTAKAYISRAKETIMSDSLYQGAIVNFKAAAKIQPGTSNLNQVVTYLKLINHYNTSSPLGYKFYVSSEQAHKYIAEAKKELEAYYAVEKDERVYTVKKAQIFEVENAIQ